MCNFHKLSLCYALGLCATITSYAGTQSTCYGTPSKGHLANSIALPLSGKNWGIYTELGYQLGRTYVHSNVGDIVVKAYSQLESTAAGKKFSYGETGLKNGGVFSPHRSHQNGTSIDFMVPVVDEHGKSVHLPMNPLNKFGYDIEFDAQGRFKNLTIDFEAMSEHLYQLHIAAKQADQDLVQVIFDRQYLPKLFATKRGTYLRKSLSFMQKTPWIRHDEHYHVDFKIDFLK
jgi:penicillin-insensitive murein endopeptidase